jgi:hypothetical protein
LVPFLIENGCLTSDFHMSVKPKAISERTGQTVTKLEGTFDPWVPDRVDYMHDYR